MTGRKETNDEVAARLLPCTCGGYNDTGESIPWNRARHLSDCPSQYRADISAELAAAEARGLERAAQIAEFLHYHYDGIGGSRRRACYSKDCPPMTFVPDGDDIAAAIRAEINKEKP